jgi:type IV pilus assembly protein PilW
MSLATKHRHQQGRSLIELMIALVISLIVLGAVTLTIMGTNVTGDQQDAQARLNEEAAVALALLSNHIRVAGYSAPIGGVRSTPATLDDRNYSGPPVSGCENGFNGPGNLNGACAGGAVNSAPDGIAVFFEADQFNTVPNAAGGAPTDCRGFNIAATAVSAVDKVTPFTLAQNYYFINTVDNTLSCVGNGGNVIPQIPQPLISNVTDMQIRYGVADVTPLGYVQYSPTRYLTATQVTALPVVADSSGQSVTGWQRVVSAEICIEMQSDDLALDQPMAPYNNCRLDANGNTLVSTPTDKRAHRVSRAIVTIRNRAAPCVRPAIRAVTNADLTTACSPA